MCIIFILYIYTIYIYIHIYIYIYIYIYIHYIISCYIILYCTVLYCIRLYYTNIRLYWVVLYSVILIIIYHIILYKRVWTCLDIWAWGITEVNIAMSVLKRLITLWQGACDWWATASQTQVQDSKRAQQSRTVWSLRLSCKPFLIYLIRLYPSESLWGRGATVSVVPGSG